MSQYVCILVYLFTYLFTSMHLCNFWQCLISIIRILFSFIQPFVLPVVWHRVTQVSHQQSLVLGPEDRLRCCTRPWVQTALQRGPDASGRYRSPPQQEHTALHLLYQPGLTERILRIINISRKQYNILQMTEQCGADHIHVIQCYKEKTRRMR